MRNTVAGTSFKAGAGLIAVVVVAIHICLCAFAVFAPKSTVHAWRITSWYDRLIILGPFFQEARIKSTPHVFVSAYEHGDWSPQEDVSVSNFDFYRRHPWRYDKLHEGDFERNTALRVSRITDKTFEEIKSSRAFRELNEVIVAEDLRRNVDSVRVIYGLNVYLPDLSAYRFDTLFHHTYAPADVAPAKRID